MENNQFMIFYRESDFQYFLFNGEWPINIMQEHLRVSLTDSNYSDEAIREVESLVPTLKEVLDNPRKKVFTLKGRRYIIQHRGKFLTV